MFDFAWSEIMLIGIIALVVIGPKDMPTALRAVSQMVKKARRLAAEFQGHVDDMVRDADLGEARESLRELKSLNLRGQVMRALDEDGSLRRTLRDNPLSAVPPAASAALPDAVEVTPPAAIRSVAPELAEQAVPVWRSQPSAADEAPSFIPPHVGRRLQRERAAPPPEVLPPGALRPIADAF